VWCANPARSLLARLHSRTICEKGTLHADRVVQLAAGKLVSCCGNGDFAYRVSANLVSFIAVCKVGLHSGAVLLVGMAVAVRPSHLSESGLDLIMLQTLSAVTVMTAVSGTASGRVLARVMPGEA
jgi:hypothetical protein